MAASTNYLSWNYGELDKFFDGAMTAQGVSEYYIHPLKYMGKSADLVNVPTVQTFNYSYCPPTSTQIANSSVILDGTFTFYFETSSIYSPDSYGKTAPLVACSSAIGTARKPCELAFYELPWDGKPKLNGKAMAHVKIGDSAVANWNGAGFSKNPIFNFVANFKPASCWIKQYAETKITVPFRVKTGGSYFAYVKYDQTYT